MGDAFMILHLNFIKELIISIAYLIPLIIVWRLKNRSPDELAGPLDYVLAGFMVGFLVRLVGGLIRDYVIQLPLLPLKLHEEGVPSEFMGRITALYSTAFTILYIASLFVTLLLVTYGICRLVTVLRES